MMITPYEDGVDYPEKGLCSLKAEGLSRRLGSASNNEYVYCSQTRIPYLMEIVYN